ncbi:MAG: HAD family hydrolase, partial [Nitrososphaera sp.]|nr:HAD family hydrolase [Nitrososphaera sp.]
GYGKVIEGRLEPEIKKGRKALFKFSNDGKHMLMTLEKRGYEMGLIANQSEDILGLLTKSDMARFFKVKAISSSVKLQKPDPKIFELAIRQAHRAAGECVMVGDRLDTDICPANRAGMTTIRTTNSLFNLQQPAVECEFAYFTVAKLAEIPAVLERIL